MTVLKRLFVSVLIISISPLFADWPQFRGPGASGVSAGKETPTTWNVETKENVAWMTPIPGMAHSSPIVWKDRIYLTTVIGPGDRG